MNGLGVINELGIKDLWRTEGKALVSKLTVKTGSTACVTGSTSLLLNKKQDGIVVTVQTYGENFLNMA